MEDERTISLQIFAEEPEDKGEAGGEGAGLMGETKPAPEHDWRETLPDDIKHHPSAQKFKTPEAALRSYIELEKTLGRDKIPIPSDNASPEEMDAFFRKLGRPESPSEYKVEMPEDVSLNEEALNLYKGIAHKANLTNKQFDDLVKGAFDAEQVVAEKMSSDFQEHLEGLRKNLQDDWGDKYNENIHKANLALEKSGVEGIWEWADKAGVLNDPTFTRLLAHYGSSLSESGNLKGGGEAGTLNSVTAQSRLDEIMADPDKKKAYLRGDKSIVKQITDLNVIIYGNEPITE